MIKLIETTTFKNGEPKKVSEVKYKDIHALYKALSQSGVKGEVVYNLKKHKRAIIDYDDAQTVLEVDMPRIILTDSLER